MKIKELFETVISNKLLEEENLDYFTIKLVADSPMRLPVYQSQKSFEEMIEKFCKDSGYHSKYINWGIYSMNAVFEVKTASQYDGKKIEKFFEDLIEKFKNYFAKNDLDIKTTSLEFFCYGLPKHPLELNHGKIEIWCNENQSISNLDKLVKKCNDLIIYSPDKIIGGVLSLLNIKTPIQFQGEHSGVTIKAPWIKIVQKYLKTDGDVLECQEELIEAGLEEYAKL